MVTVPCGEQFEETIRKIKDARLRERVKKQIAKIVNDPLSGKPIRYSRIFTARTGLSPALSGCERSFPPTQ